jgi:hypothetical protein
MQSTSASTRSFLRRSLVFCAIGLLLYLAAYGTAGRVAAAHAGRNRFHAVAAHPPTTFDHVILGASHAAVLDYRDLTPRLEALTGSRIINLSIVGGGVVPNRLLFDYLRTRHRVRSMVYVADSFAFASRQWNEDRLSDTRLFRVAPFDPALARLLLRRPSTWLTAIDYISGFSKINNPDRFVPDVPADEGSRFDRVYRPVPQLDEQRVAYLHPSPVDAAVMERYLADLDALVAAATQGGIAVGVIKPPLPERVRRALPDEPTFDRRLSELVSRHGGRFTDFSQVADDARHFADTDHLNYSGVRAFHEHLAPWLDAQCIVAASEAR